MKRRCVLKVNSTDQLKVKQHTIILTGQDKEGDDEDDVIQCVFHITVAEVEAYEEDDHEGFEYEVEAAPPELEDVVKSTVDELKKLNLGTEEDPRSIFVSASLNSQEEKEYYDLLLEYKNVFAWT